jgi:PEGA domain
MRNASVSHIRILVLFSLLTSAVAKDQPTQVINWPESGATIVRFTLGKFKEIGSYGSRRTYVIDTTAENVSAKLISNGSFFLYLFDKNKTRIGEGWITLTNVGPGQAVKFQVNVDTSGAAVTALIVARSDAPHKISITVNSVPQGALLKIDGNDSGTTPKLVSLGTGKHILEFSKEGFSTGHFPLDVGPSDVSGGSVSFELGTVAYDTLELRDGTVLTGDLESVSATEVVVRSGGKIQHLTRNQVKRILLVEREQVSSPAD